MPVYRFENVTLDIDRRELRRDGELRAVEPQVFDLLHFLVRNRDRVVTRDEIFNDVWRGRIVSDSVLGTRVNGARAAIGDSGVAQRFIRTARGVGFRFVANVVEVEPVSALTALPPAPSVTARHWFAGSYRGAPAVAILPFAASGEPKPSTALAAGLTEELLYRLYRVGWLHVVHRPAIVLPKDNRAHGAAGGRARYLIDGSIRQAGDHVRVTVRLVDTGSGHCIWSEQLDYAAADRFQQALAATIAARVSAQIVSAESIRAKCSADDNRSAWDAIISALALMNTRDKKNVAAAQVLLRKSIAMDQSATAYALLSFVTTLGVHLGWHSREAVRPVAFRAAERALALDDEEPWAHLALGYATLQIANQPGRSIAMFDRALQLDPNLSVAHYFTALASSYLGLTTEAFARADMAERLRSFDLLAYGNPGAADNVRATASFVAGRYRDGIAFAQRALEQCPVLVPALRQLVTNGAFAGDQALAAQALVKIRRLAPGVQRWLAESRYTWASSEAYRNYAEAFRAAGHRS